MSGRAPEWGRRENHTKIDHPFRYSASRMPSRRTIGFAATAIALTTAIALIGAEIGIRVADPQPRRQIVRPGQEAKLEVRVSHGAPVWEQHGTVTRRNLDCEGDIDILLLGSSILFGTSLETADSIGPALEAALARVGTTACVHNWAQPAFTAQGKLALAKEAFERGVPDVVIWETWIGDANRYTLLGDTAYELTGYPADEAGFPVVTWAPSAIHQALFTRSRLWEYAVLATSSPSRGAVDAAWEVVVGETLPELRAQTGDVPLILMPMPKLDRSFEQSSVDTLDPALFPRYDQVRKWTLRQGAGVELFEVAHALQAEDHEALRLDSCCHYNQDGQRALAQALVPVVLAATLTSQGPTPQTPSK